MSEFNRHEGSATAVMPRASGATADRSQTVSSATLERVLEAVESQQRQGRFEFAMVFILGLTALASTWCAYQSQLWNGVQTVRLADAEAATQEAQGGAMRGMQRRTMDGLVVLHYMEAMHRQDKTITEALQRRMVSPLREAIAASLALDPLNNPNAPGPLHMPQYVLPEEKQAEAAQARASDMRSQAQVAGNAGDSYVLLTLLFATVLFFGGITGTFQSRRLRTGLGAVAFVLFVATVSYAATMPVCRS